MNCLLSTMRPSLAVLILIAPVFMPFRHSAIAVLSTLVLSMTTLGLFVAPVQAGLFDIFFPRRGEGNPTGRERGGTVRASVRAVGGTNPAIPYVISPRNTLVRADELTIRWHPIPAASAYTVRLWRWDFLETQRERLLWEIATTSTEVVYPDASQLEAGRYYSVEVIADTGVSSEADALATLGKSGFRPVFPEDVAVIADLETQVLAQYLPPAEIPTASPMPDLATVVPSADQREAIAVDLAGLYLLENLYAEAIALLQPFANAGTDNPMIYEILGDFYSYTGLNQLAREQYETAADLSTANQDRLGQGIALVGLAEVNATLGEMGDELAGDGQLADIALLERAIAQFRAAERIYTELGYTEAANYVARRIYVINQRLADSRPASLPSPSQ